MPAHTVDKSFITNLFLFLRKNYVVAKVTKRSVPCEVFLNTLTRCIYLSQALCPAAQPSRNGANLIDCFSLSLGDFEMQTEPIGHYFATSLTSRRYHREDAEAVLMLVTLPTLGIAFRTCAASLTI